ncbi:GntR family transcriptional regulator (plasmid) [Lentzea sp. JNUCC 0626]|uniref:GntR family transcriptional regulator n=1 Tax=Lentzea sp. JNUCC 0626 TaxID=3367513 RepID=UPI0037483911
MTVTTRRASAELITAELREAIEAGMYREGMALPSKSSLRRQYGCSNDVAQSVFNNLAAEGLIVTRSGAGAFVRPPAVVFTPDELISGFSKPAARRVPAPRWVAELLQVEHGTEVDRTDAVLEERALSTWLHPTRTGAPERFETYVQARAGTADERGLLGLRPGTPVLVMVRIHRASGGGAVAVERVTSVGAASTLTLGDRDG